MAARGLEEYTLDGYIQQMKEAEIQFGAFVDHFIMKDNTGKFTIYPDEILLSKYQQELRPYLAYMRLSEKEYQVYEYNPRLFAHKIYGDPSYWFLIMWANEIYSASEFCINPVRFYTKDCYRVLNSIIRIETINTDADAQKINDAIANRVISS